MKALYCTLYNMLGETEKSSDVCRTASLSEMGHEQRAATSSTVTDQRWKNFFVLMGWVYSYDTGVRTGLQLFLSYHDIHAVLHSQFYVVQYESCVVSHTHIVDCRYRHRCHVSFCLCITFHMITQKD